MSSTTADRRSASSHQAPVLPSQLVASGSCTHTTRPGIDALADAHRTVRRIDRHERRANAGVGRDADRPPDRRHRDRRRRRRRPRSGPGPPDAWPCDRPDSTRPCRSATRRTRSRWAPPDAGRDTSPATAWGSPGSGTRAATPGRQAERPRAATKARVSGSNQTARSSGQILSPLLTPVPRTSSTPPVAFCRLGPARYPCREERPPYPLSRSFYQTVGWPQAAGQGVSCPQEPSWRLP